MSNTHTLTANSRLARHLLEDFHSTQSPEKMAWETPTILPLQSWLHNQFYQQNETGLIVLSDFQEQCVWESIITTSPIASDILHCAQLAKLVKDAWKILTQWQLTVDALIPFVEQDSVRYLLDWIMQFQTQCQKNNWITSAELPRFLQQKDAQKPLLLPNKIILIGFDEINPDLQALLWQLGKRIVIETNTLEIKSDAVRITLENTEAELTTMAKWMKAKWEKNPTATLGCVIPELEKMRKQVDRIFNDIFCVDVKPYNISAATPLFQNTLVNTALKIVQWCYQPLPITSLATLLQSPYLCENEMESCMGAQMDALLREKNQLSIAITDLFSVITPLQTQYPNQFYLSRWRKLIDASKKITELKTTPSKWANQIITLLKIIQWPGARTQTSNEFQALERFKKLLTEFSQLDLLLSEISFSRACYVLQSLAQQTLFQPNSHHEPIQIMGVLEASNIVFDAAWVMGLHDGIWPAATKPHPLIPYALQQTHHMPHATAKRELDFCNNITKRLKNSAKQVIFSSPESEGDQHLFPSRLIQTIPVIAEDQLVLSQSQTQMRSLFQLREQESVTDDRGPAIHDFSAIEGGSHILTLQALCPFRAFATIRLKANRLNTPTIGISAVKKGIIIHHILFELWSDLKSQQQLKALNENELDQFILEKIEKTFATLLSKSITDENNYFFTVEKKRLQQVIKNWLLFEKTRPDFKIHTLETSCHIVINQLPIKIRLDRVDELSDGALLLIDYKTGKSDILTLLQEKLTHPQLPIYAAFQETQEKNYAAVAFADVNNEKSLLRGISNDAGIEQNNLDYKITPIHKIKNEMNISDWTALLSHWKNNLTQLAEDFCNSNAMVNPIEPSVCETCDLKSVCRVGGSYP